jgi:hypothetical protein
MKRALRARRGGQPRAPLEAGFQTILLLGMKKATAITVAFSFNSWGNEN